MVLGWFLVVFAMALAASCVVGGINVTFYGCFSSFGVFNGGFVSFCWFFLVFVSFWMVFGWFLVVFCNKWQQIGYFGNNWKQMASFGYNWQLLATIGKCDLF